MKTSELVVGKDYAYQQYKYGEHKRVTVLETNVQRSTGYGYSSKKVRNGVRVKFADSGAEFVVTSRQIEQAWDTYAAYKAKQDEWKAASDAAHLVDFRERLETILALDKALVERGAEASVHSVFLHRADEEDAFREVFGQKIVSPDEQFSGLRVTTTVHSLDDAVRKNHFNIKDIRLLLEPATAPVWLEGELARRIANKHVEFESVIKPDEAVALAQTVMDVLVEAGVVPEFVEE